MIDPPLCAVPSPVVKFVSAATTGGAADSAAASTAQPPIYHTLVQSDDSRWELPPLSTVTLQSVHREGTWGAYGAPRVQRTLYCVTVAWSANGDAAVATPPRRAEASVDTSPPAEAPPPAAPSPSPSASRAASPAASPAASTGRADGTSPLGDATLPAATPAAVDISADEEGEGEGK